MRWFLTLAACWALFYGFSGCDQKAKPAPAPAPQAAAESADHGHDHPAHGAGPHGGTLSDWGGGAYHVEFTVDHEKQQATVYIVGGDEKSPAPIKTEVVHLTISEPMTEVDLTAKPLAKETEGTSSRFVGTHKNLGKVQEFAGTISGEVDGTPYVGEFKEEPHAAPEQK